MNANNENKKNTKQVTIKNIKHSNYVVNLVMTATTKKTIQLTIVIFLNGQHNKFTLFDFD